MQQLFAQIAALHSSSSVSAKYCLFTAQLKRRKIFIEMILLDTKISTTTKGGGDDDGHDFVELF